MSESNRTLSLLHLGFVATSVSLLTLFAVGMVRMPEYSKKVRIDIFLKINQLSKS